MRVTYDKIYKFDDHNLDRLNMILSSLQAAVNTVDFGEYSAATSGVVAENVFCDFQTLECTAGEYSKVAHNLGRTPIGVIPIKMQCAASGVAFSTVSASAHDSSYIYLLPNATASGTVMII